MGKQELKRAREIAHELRKYGLRVRINTDPISPENQGGCQVFDYDGERVLLGANFDQTLENLEYLLRQLPLR